MTTEQWIEKILADDPRLVRLLAMADVGHQRHYDRNGEPISFGFWAVLFESMEYRRLAYSDVGPWYVSTVWLGLDHGFGHGVPTIFESMVFTQETSVSKLEGMPEFLYHEEREQWRYASEQDALEGHRDLVEQCEAQMKINAIDPREER